RGDFDTASALDDVVKHLHRYLFIESSPIPAKYGLHKMGMIDTRIRLPLVWLAKEHHATIDTALAQANLL
ncbi:dihydrodipicolinate synthase family protein, partial [Psychrobacter sp. FBL11]